MPSSSAMIVLSLAAVACAAPITLKDGHLTGLHIGVPASSLDERSLISSLIGATDDSLGKVVGNAAIGGAASGAANGITGDILDKLKGIFRRELDERSLISSLVGATDDSLGKVVGNAAIGGAASGAANGITGDILDKLKSIFRRELDERSLISSLIGATDDSLGKVVGNAAIGGAASGAANGVTGDILDKLKSIFRRELDERSLISSLVGATDDSLGKVVGNAAIGGAASGAANGITGDILDKLKEIFRRELEAREQSLNELD